MLSLSILIFIIGVCIGSFLNCLIYRLEENKKATGRSFCPHCKHTLGWKDLFPVFSFIFLKGKCRYCKEKISWQYPVVEIATGVMFWIVFSKFGVDLLVFLISGDYFAFALAILNLLLLLFIVSALIVIFIFDLKHYLIPEQVLFPAIGAAFMLIFFSHLGFWNFALATIISTGFFAIIYYLSRGKWMGFGDVEIAFFMGFLLGFPNVLVALFLAFFFGAIISLILLGFYGKNLKSQVPFGPFLITGTFIALLWGSQIINWYLNFFSFK